MSHDRAPFDEMRDTLHALMRELHYDRKVLKLLNVGSDRAGEYHWRFKVQGSIVNLSMRLENNGS